jgi:IMP dehydrogenase
MKIVEKGYTFDDLLLIPSYSEIHPSDVNLNSQIGKINLSIPLVSAAMDTVTEKMLATKLAQLGGLGIIHKNMSVTEQIEQIKFVRESNVSADACIDSEGKLAVGAAIGVGPLMVKRARSLIENGCQILLIDSAHGHSKAIIETTKMVRALSQEVTLIVGNIVTAAAVVDLASAGADCVKVGIGPGSICTTRIISGVGYPQLSAISNVVAQAKKLNIDVIADGGIKYSGDIVKALGVGANAVMLGNIFARTLESPGKVIVENGISYKEYVGMGSIAAMQRGSSDRYFQENTNTQKLVPEGVEGRVAIDYNLNDCVMQLVGGIRSGMGYLGSNNLTHLYKTATFVETTISGQKENHPHSLAKINKTLNYK